MGDVKVVGVGPKVEGIQHYNAKLPARVDGEHLWIVMSMFRVTPAVGATYHMDTESILTIEGPGCCWCEQTWRPGAELTRCPGAPQP